VPGIRSKAPGISPEKIAMAVAVTIAAIAGTGGIKKVMGTSKAVAIVALKPGIAPTKSPKRAEHKMTSNTYGSNTSQKACNKTAVVILFFLYH
jgi:hypothetical protein